MDLRYLFQYMFIYFDITNLKAVEEVIQVQIMWLPIPHLLMESVKNFCSSSRGKEHKWHYLLQEGRYECKNVAWVIHWCVQLQIMWLPQPAKTWLRPTQVFFLYSDKRQCLRDFTCKLNKKLLSFQRINSKKFNLPITKSYRISCGTLAIRVLVFFFFAHPTCFGHNGCVYKITPKFCGLK